jgi:hypothetical protein
MSLYVYGFVPASMAPARPIRVNGHRIELLRIARIAVAIERLPERPSMSESSLRTQHAIVERLAKRCQAVLPARFGSFIALDDLQRIVRGRQADLREALRTVHRRVQMTIRIVTSHPANSRGPVARAATSGVAYLNARRASISASLPPVAVVVIDAVRTLVRGERIENDRESGRTAVFHLIDRTDVRRYRSSIASLTLPTDDSVTATGPFAPFAFAPELWP